MSEKNGVRFTGFAPTFLHAPTLGRTFFGFTITKKEGVVEVVEGGSDPRAVRGLRYLKVKYLIKMTSSPSLSVLMVPETPVQCEKHDNFAVFGPWRLDVTILILAKTMIDIVSTGLLISFLMFFFFIVSLALSVFELDGGLFDPLPHPTQSEGGSDPNRALVNYT